MKLQLKRTSNFTWDKLSQRRSWKCQKATTFTKRSPGKSILRGLCWLPNVRSVEPFIHVLTPDIVRCGVETLELFKSTIDGDGSLTCPTLIAKYTTCVVLLLRSCLKQRSQHYSGQVMIVWDMLNKQTMDILTCFVLQAKYNSLPEQATHFSVPLEAYNEYFILKRDIVMQVCITCNHGGLCYPIFRPKQAISDPFHDSAKTIFL